MNSGEKKRKFKNFDVTNQDSIVELLMIISQEEEDFYDNWAQTLFIESKKISQEFEQKYILGKKITGNKLDILQETVDLQIKEFKKKRYLTYESEFLIFKYKILKEIAPNISPQELWRIQMGHTLHLLQNITDLKFQWELFTEDHLPARCYNNLTFVASLLIVGEFITHQVSAGFYRKHDDGFDAKEKEDNSDIISHFKEKFPNIMLDRAKEERESFGFTYRIAGVNDIFLNLLLYQNALKIDIKDTESINRYAFIIAFTILHELCHFKIRNFHDKSGNLNDSPEKFKESGKCLELELFHGKIGFLGENFHIEKCLVCVESTKNYRELEMEHIELWFKEEYWKSCKSKSDFVVNLKSLKIYKKNSGDRISKEMDAFGKGLDAFDRVRCATYFLKDPILPDK